MTQRPFFAGYANSRVGLLLLLVLVSACRPAAPSGADAANAHNEAPRLPTGARLDPAGTQSAVGNFPLTAVLSPDSSQLLLLLNGWRQQGVQVVDRRTGAIMQTVEQAAAFIGLAFSPDGRSVFASGGNTDVVYRYDWRSSRLTLRDSIVLQRKDRPRDPGTRYPAGVAINKAGTRLFVVENLSDSLAVVDLATNKVLQRLPAGRYPYGVVIGDNGVVYVSSWGTAELLTFVDDGTGWLRKDQHKTPDEAKQDRRESPSSSTTTTAPGTTPRR